MSHLVLTLVLLLSVALEHQSRRGATANSGRALLEAAIDALGGAKRLAALDEWIVAGEGRENLSGDLQGVASDSPTWRPHAETVAILRGAGTVAWERKSERNDGSLRWRRFIYTQDGLGVIDWSTRRTSRSQVSVSAAVRTSMQRRVPHVLLGELAATASAIDVAGTRTLGGSVHDVLRVTTAGGEALTLILSRSPVTLRRIEYPLLLPGLGMVTVGWEWQDWKRSPDLGMIPAGHTLDVRGIPFQEVRYTRFEAGSEEARRFMEIPDTLGRAAQAAPLVSSASLNPTGEVSPGVHVLNLRGFVVMLVEFRDFVVALEAPETHPGLEAIPASGQDEAGLVTKDYLAAIDRLFPTKPVRFLVVSHHHSDHLGGVRAFAARGATIVAAPDAGRVAKQLLEAPRDERVSILGGAVPRPKIKVVFNRDTISDGSRFLEIINVGKNPHTSENLVVWLPAEGIVFQGDLYYFAMGSPFPPSGRATMNAFFAEWLANRRITPRAIYGVHNRGAAGPEALAASRR
jgi:glyoxylase-like metal-dependent hydrolase (beta-lactamase superfamily II)